MPKALCLVGSVVAVLLLLVFGLDLAFGFPFRRVNGGEGIDPGQVHAGEFFCFEHHLADGVFHRGAGKVGDRSFVAAEVIENGALTAIGLADEGNNHGELPGSGISFAQISANLSLLSLNCNRSPSFLCRQPRRLLPDYGQTAPDSVRLVPELPLKS